MSLHFFCVSSVFGIVQQQKHKIILVFSILFRRCFAFVFLVFHLLFLLIIAIERTAAAAHDAHGSYYYCRFSWCVLAGHSAARSLGSQYYFVNGCTNIFTFICNNFCVDERAAKKLCNE